MPKIKYLTGLSTALLLAPLASFAAPERPNVPVLSTDRPYAPVPLGKLDAFWRYSAGLGPFHEGGQGLTSVPDILLTGSFPYRKRPFPQEALFADHLSLVRFLGGFGSDKGQPDPAFRERDLAWRDADGKIRYRMELVGPRLKPYLDNGYTNLTIVLDNVPWCFPEKPEAKKFGQVVAPRSAEEWKQFIEVLCREIVKTMGSEAAGRLRFRVGTENGSEKRFVGTHNDYVRHYQSTVAAVRSVLPTAQIGPYNISGGVSLEAVQTRHNVRPLDLAVTCYREANPFDQKRPTPIDFVAYSRYFRPGDKPVPEHIQPCQEVWEAFGRRVPELKDVSREIHEFGFAPWGELEQGVFATAEPGALGAAMTCQMMLRLREVGIRRLWHWGVLDKLRGAKDQASVLPTGLVWLMSVLEYMREGESFLLPAPDSRTGTCHLALMTRTAEADLFLVSAYNPALADHTATSAVFRLPALLNGMTLQGARCMRLDRTTSIHDGIRRELKEAGHLGDDFTRQPERLGNVREMIKDKAGERLVAEHLGKYNQQWTASMTLRPMADGVAVIGKDGGTNTLTVTLTPPELLVISIPRANGQRN
jgi:hypothetical protein